MYIIYASKHNGKPPHLVDGQNPLVILAEPGFEKLVYMSIEFIGEKMSNIYVLHI
jgi:hypothetical protein